MNPRYEKYLNCSNPDRPVFEATRITGYCVFTRSMLKAARVALVLDEEKPFRRVANPRGSVNVDGEEIEYTTVLSDIEIDETDKR